MTLHYEITSLSDCTSVLNIEALTKWTNLTQFMDCPVQKYLEESVQWQRSHDLLQSFTIKLDHCHMKTYQNPGSSICQLTSGGPSARVLGVVLINPIVKK